MKLGETSTTGDEEGEKSTYDMHQPACFSAEPQTPRASSASEHFSPAILSHRTICTASCVSRRENAHKHEVQAVGGCTCHIPTKAAVLEALNQFVGEIEQIPPIYSAVKVNGQRAYKLARAGKEVVIEPRKVTIHEITEVSYDYPTVKFTTKVSSGTYIRTLVEDLGTKLGTGAYMPSLRRTEVGDFTLLDAVAIEDFTPSDVKTH
jgi:tRNA U55 pseudouridine synthase TruB